MKDGTIRMSFYDVPPSLGGKEGVLRMPWRRRQELEQRWLAMVELAGDLVAEETKVAPIKRCSIQYEVQYPSIWTWDAVASTWHLLGKSLVKAGILVSDRTDVVKEFTPKFSIGRAQCSVTITPEEEHAPLVAALTPKKEVAIPK